MRCGIDDRRDVSRDGWIRASRESRMTLMSATFLSGVQIHPTDDWMNEWHGLKTAIENDASFRSRRARIISVANSGHRIMRTAGFVGVVTGRTDSVVVLARRRSGRNGRRDGCEGHQQQQQYVWDRRRGMNLIRTTATTDDGIEKPKPRPPRGGRRNVVVSTLRAGEKSAG